MQKLLVLLAISITLTLACKGPTEPPDTIFATTTTYSGTLEEQPYSKKLTGGGFIMCWTIPIDREQPFLFNAWVYHPTYGMTLAQASPCPEGVVIKKTPGITGDCDYLITIGGN